MTTVQDYPVTTRQVKEVAERVSSEVSKVVVGKNEELKMIIACLIAGGASDNRGEHDEASLTLHRLGNAEPDRVRGYLPAARGADRPISHADRNWLPYPHGDDPDPQTAATDLRMEHQTSRR